MTSPDAALLDRVHLASDRAVEVFGEVLVVGQAAEHPVPARRMRTDLKRISFKVVLVCTLVDLTPHDQEIKGLNRA